MIAKIYLAVIALFFSLTITAQRSCGLWLNEIPLVADTAANKIYVTIEPTNVYTLTGTFKWNADRFSNVKLNGTELQNGLLNNFSVADWSSKTTNTLTITDSERKDWTLVFSTLPFLVIDCPLQTMTDNYSVTKGDEEHTRKYPGYMTVIDARCRTKIKDSAVEGMASFSSDINIRLRGATSGSAPKKSFNIELTKDGESNDAHILGYRKDDDWILASEYTDYSRMRNRVIMDLWNSVDDLPYDKDNDYQCNGTQGEFVELFMNGAYYGLETFTDKIDRKKLNLKKMKEATATTPAVQRGLLWKANLECSETYLSSYSARPENNYLLWPLIDDAKGTYGWDQKYPDDNDSLAFFDPICDIIDLISSKASTTNFRANYKNYLYEQNVTDFILFIQAFQLVDNQKKNYYLSVRNHDDESKFLFTLWDLDGSMGRLAGGDVSIDDPKQLAWGEKLGYHNLIHRFKTEKLRPLDFATTMNNRWQYLSTHQLSLENIRKVMEKYGNLFTTSGAWEREKQRWTPAYKNKVKIANTPQEEIEFMMSFLENNWAIFNEKMASSSWEHDDYSEDDYTKKIAPKALYIVGNDVVSTHEDNTAVLPGTISQEKVDGIEEINFRGGQMNVVREDGQNQYAMDEIKELRTDNNDLYHTPAFIPDSLAGFFTFDTHYAPVSETIVNQDSVFNVHRTIQVNFDGNSAEVKGNLAGITATVENANVSFTTELEGVQILIGGTSDNGSITISSTHPCMIAASEEGAMLSGITANCDITVNTPYALNFYNDVFDGKCISTTGDVTFEDGSLYFLMTGSGTVTDADFSNNPTLGARAVIAENITINGGKLFIKTLGDNGAVGLAAVKNITINGGQHYITTYDDPIKAGSSVTINDGFVFTSSLTNDGLDSKGDIFVNGGTISTYGPDGAEAAYDVNHFYCDGGTVIGVGYKSETPMASKSEQPSFRLYKIKGVKKYVKIQDPDNQQIAIIETPSYATTTVVYSSPALVKGSTYTILTGDSLEALETLTTAVAE